MANILYIMIINPSLRHESEFFMNVQCFELGMEIVFIFYVKRLRILLKTCFHNKFQYVYFYCMYNKFDI